MRHKFKLFAMNIFLTGFGLTFGGVALFDNIVEQRARKLLANPAWEAERITREAVNR